MKLGILSNRYSDRNGGQSQIASFCTQYSDVAFAAPEDLSSLPAALTDFARLGVDVLAIDGGDGTIRDVLSTLPDAFGDRWPALTILPSGKTNLIARDVGTFGGGIKGVARLVKAIRAGTVTIRQRAVLEAVRGGGLPIVRGLFFGAGIFTHATEMAAVWTFGRGIKQSAGVALTMAQVVWQYLRGKHEGSPMAAPAGEAVKPHFVVLATTLEKLMLGFWPFAATGTGALKWLAVEAPPRHLLSVLWAAWRGRMDARPGCRSARTDAIAIALQGRFVVDGEIYAPGPEGVLLRAGPALRFLSPRTTASGAS